MKRFYTLALCSLMPCIFAAAANRIVGRVVDGCDRTPLAGAAVVLYDRDTVQIRGVAADAEGQFEIADVFSGDYLLRFSFLGYEPQTIALAQLHGNVDLGDVALLPSSETMEAVVVRGDAVIRSIDRRTVLPTAAQRRASTNGLTLLQHLQISGIAVNSLDRSVTTLYGEAVQLRINGVEAAREEVAALRPADVVRIEYHDNPGLRYGGAAAVLDYIVARPEQGGSVAADLANGIDPLGYGEYNLSARYDRNASSVAAAVAWERRDLRWNRENYETFRYPDLTLANEEIGLPTRFRYERLNISLSYTLTDGERSMLNIALRDRYDYTPNSFSDRNSRLTQNGTEYSIADNMRSRSNIPSIDIYYQLRLKNGGHIYLDAVGTYLDSRSSRTYTMSAADAAPMTVFSQTEGDKYSLIGELIYEQPLWGGKLTAGLKHSESRMNNIYDGDRSGRVEMHSAESYLFAEYRGDMERFSYVAGIGVMRMANKQGADGRVRYIARPTLTLSYRPVDNLFLRYNAYMSGYAPSLSAMSDVAQGIDAFSVRRGNPDLRSVVFFANTLSAGWRSRCVSVELSGRYSYDDRPIMERTVYEDGVFVRSYANQRGFHRLNVDADIRIMPFEDHLVIRLAPFFNRYVSLGGDYTHTHSNFGLRGGVMAVCGRWSFMFEMNTSFHELWGETLTRGEAIHTFAVGYNRDKWAVQAMVMNPFSRRYSQEAVNLSYLAPYRQVAFSRDLSPMFMLDLSFNFDFGKQRRAAGRRIENTDTDTGILSGSK